MKNKALSLLCVCMCQSVWSQPTEVAVPVVIDLGPHTRTWQWINTAHETNTFVELQTGLNYDDNGVWTESKEIIERTIDGAAARYGQAKVYFPGNLKANWVEVDTADGKVLKSQVRALAWYDSASGKSVVIGQLQDSVGQLVSSNQIVYANAFPQAEVRYTYRKSGLEQDIIVRGPLPPLPAGFSEANTRLWVITEFSQPPAPAVDVRYLYQETKPVLRQQIASPDFIDEFLSFGWMVMGQGKAFDLADPNASASLASIPVGKQWITVTNGATYLVEAVRYPAIKTLLVKLAGAADGQDRRAVAPAHPWKEMLAALGNATPSQADKTPVTVRRADAARPATERGLVLDYVILNSATNFTFQGDTTYYVPSSVTLSATTTIEGGAVVKFTNVASYAQITLGGPLICQTGPYRPGVFTSKDDNSIGDAISGSTGSPSGFYGQGLAISGTTTTLSHLRFAYTYPAVTLASSGSVAINHCQFVDSSTVLSGQSSTTFTLGNCLFYQVTNVLSGDDPMTFTGVNLTVHDCTGSLAHTSTSPPNQSVLNLTNSLLVAVNSQGNFSTQNLDSTTVSLTSDRGVFLSMGAGSHYLIPNSPFRNIGTSAIDPTLLTNLMLKTTYAPMLLVSNFTVSTVLSNVIHRDVDTPDIGYHYDPLDYSWTGLQISTGKTLTLTNGVAVGVFGARGPVLQGSTSQFISWGTANSLNRLVDYRTVQEQPLLWTGTNLNQVIGMPSSGGTVQLNFTDVSLMARNAFYRQLISQNGGAFNSVSAFGSQLRGIYVDIYDTTSDTGGAMTFALTNTLALNCFLEFYQDTIPGYYNFTVNLYNNLLRHGTLEPYYNANGTTWTIKDNLLDAMTVTQPGTYCVNNAHNGYYPNTATKLCGSGGGDKTLYLLDYQTGPLGDKYYPTSGTNLYTLVDAGSRTASAAGLTSYATEANLVADTGTVDIGYHYLDLPWTPLVSISANIPNAVEPPNTVNGQFTVSCQPAAPSGGLSVSFSIWGSAQNSVNYTLTDANNNTISGTSGTVTIPANTTSTTLTVAPINDGVLDYPNTVVLALQLPSNNSYLIGQPSLATVNIQDNGQQLPGFTTVVSGLTNPVSIQYDALSNVAILSVNYGTPNAANFISINTGGSKAQWSSLANFTDEIHHSVVPATGSGFNQGELYFNDGTNYPGVVGKISADHSTVTTNWAVLSNEANAIRTVYLDQTGIYGYNLLAVAGQEITSFSGGDVWQINSSGTGTLLANVGVFLEGMVTLPNYPMQYGPWAGKIITACENDGNGTQFLFTVDSSGNTAAYTGYVGVSPYAVPPFETMSVISANQYVYTVDFLNKVVYQVGGGTNAWSGFIGDLLVTVESPSELLLLRWDGNDFKSISITGPSGSQLESSTFAPINIP